MPSAVVFLPIMNEFIYKGIKYAYIIAKEQTIIIV